MEHYILTILVYHLSDGWTLLHVCIWENNKSIKTDTHYKRKQHCKTSQLTLLMVTFFTRKRTAADYMCSLKWLPKLSCNNDVELSIDVYPLGFDIYSRRRQENPNSSPMVFEGNRLGTFQSSSPLYDATFTLLARVGFYYDDATEMTKCAFCGVQYTNGRSPAQNHLQNCAYRQNGNENIPMTLLEGHGDINGRINLSEPETLPQFSMYDTIDKRAETFSREWPSDVVLQYAKEGFYSTGHADIVKCVYCGGCFNGRRHWTQDMIPPSIQHIDYFPHCPFVRHHHIDEIELVTGIEWRYVADVPTENSDERLEELTDDFRNETHPNRQSNLAVTVVEDHSVSSTLMNHPFVAQESPFEISLPGNHLNKANGTTSSQSTSSHSTSKTVTTTSNHFATPATTLDSRQYRFIPHRTSPSPSSTSNSSYTRLSPEQTSSEEMSAPSGVDPDENNYEKPKNPAYATLTTRMHTFSGWPSYIHQSPRNLSSAGFFYCGYGDITRCLYCGGGLRNWEVGDDPWVEHARWFPRCAFLRQLKGEQFDNLVQQTQNEEIGNSERSHIPDKTEVLPERRRTTEVEHVTTGSIPNRLASFYGWNSLNPQTPRHLAEAGFSFTGVGDTVRCFCCDIELGVWTSDDEPWTEHARHSPNCLFLLKKKGQNFINEVQQDWIRNKGEESGGAVSDRCFNDQQSESGIELQALQKENRKLRELFLCKICKKQERSITFIECGHFICCLDCGYENKGKDCPVCGMLVADVIKTYISSTQ